MRFDSGNGWMAVFVALVMTLGASTARPELVFENFEDGDYTSDPAWTVTLDDGEGVIEADPVRVDNLTYKARASQWHTARKIATPAGGWVGDFEASFEFLATGTRFGALVLIGNLAGFGVTSAPHFTPPDHASVWVMVPELAVASSVPITQVSLNQWWRIHSWYDADSQLFVSEWRVVENDLLIAQISWPFSISGSISDITLKTSGTDWQYVDNIVVIPEPWTALFLGLGTLCLLKMRPLSK